MTALPELVIKAWEDREGPVVLTTVAADGMPNSIYATCVGKYGDDMLVVANNYFNKTLANIQAGTKATILFRNSEGKSFQVKGTLHYFTDGPVFDDMKCWNPEQHPGHGAAAVKVEEAYSGATSLL